MEKTVKTTYSARIKEGFYGEQAGNEGMYTKRYNGN